MKMKRWEAVRFQDELTLGLCMDVMHFLARPIYAGETVEEITDRMVDLLGSDVHWHIDNEKLADGEDPVIFEFNSFEGSELAWIIQLATSERLDSWTAQFGYKPLKTFFTKDDVDSELARFFHWLNMEIEYDDIVNWDMVTAGTRMIADTELGDRDALFLKTLEDNKALVFLIDSETVLVIDRTKLEFEKVDDLLFWMK